MKPPGIAKQCRDLLVNLFLGQDGLDLLEREVLNSKRSQIQILLVERYGFQALHFVFLGRHAGVRRPVGGAAHIRRSIQEQSFFHGRRSSLHRRD